ncbi:MAG: ribbon-helix-helix domain-containing protein [Alphaproteobacteria bacterium]
MATMNISLTGEMKDAVDEAVTTRGYVSSSEYIRDLIRNDLELERFRTLIREGLESPVAGVADEAYFEALKKRLIADQVE